MGLVCLVGLALRNLADMSHELFKVRGLGERGVEEGAQVQLHLIITIGLEDGPGLWQGL